MNHPHPDLCPCPRRCDEAQTCQGPCKQIARKQDAGLREIERRRQRAATTGISDVIRGE